LVVLDDASAEIESTWAVDGDHSAAMTAAEDAAIIRQAISLLSPAERAALVMWEIEGRSTEEIAAELGIKPATVRHTVSRARLSLRRILTEVVLDEARGLTAMDMLSTSYKKASELAHKSSKAALSLILVVTAFLGFNSLTGNEALTQGGQLQLSAKPTSPTDAAKSTPSPRATEESASTAPVEVEAPVVKQAPAEKTLSFTTADYQDHMGLVKAQLDSAQLMVETMQLIEGKN
jgi:DNA-binding CsgD family transcriptional regulator